MDFSNLFMELEDKSFTRMGAFTKDNSKMKIRMGMEDKYSKTENTILASLKTIKEKD